jgi:DNA-binding XRE family transcriptional regulator
MSIKKHYNRIKVLLIESNKFSRESIQKPHCSETTVSRWYPYNPQPNLETLHKIAQFFRIEIRELILLNKDI